MKKLIALIVILGLALAAPALAAGLLDGKSFVGEMGEKGKDKGDPDDLVFKDGKYRSTGCDAYGFTETAYTAKAAGEAIAWEAVSKSPKEGVITWRGTVKGDALEATAVWEKPGQKAIEYWVKATAKK